MQKLVFLKDDCRQTFVSTQMLKGVAWYTERSISEISLGGLLVLVVIRTIQYNMLKMRVSCLFQLKAECQMICSNRYLNYSQDKYLHTNCLAALANMSAQFRSLHPYVSQRLLSLFETLAKKYARLESNIHTQSANSERTVVNVNGSAVSSDMVGKLYITRTKDFHPPAYEEAKIEDSSIIIFRFKT